MHDSGRPTPAGDDILAAVVVFDADTMTLKGDGKDAREESFSYRLDEKPDPGWFDLGEMPGIYRLRGDTLTICVNEKRGERSTAFESRKDSPNDLLLVLERQR